jgi:hypothetical protein
LPAANVCTETVTTHFVLHAAETVVTATAFLILSVYDARRRKKAPSIGIVLFQVLYALLFITQIAKDLRVDTLTQYVYQCALLVWLAWFCRDYLMGASAPRLRQKIGAVRLIIAAWAFLNGILAIVLSLADIHLLGHARALYFAADTAWLAQHRVIVGVIMLYLSRHILRGELRARQILLAIISLEVLRYALVTPNLPLLGL